jgi:integrase
VGGREDLLILHGVLERAREQHGLIDKPAARVKELKTVYDHGRCDFFSPEEVIQLADAASSEQDRALYITTAFSGLRRGELLALRWRAVDFDQEALRVVESCGQGELSRPKSGRACTVSDGRTGRSRPNEGWRGASATRSRRISSSPGSDGGYMASSAPRRRYVAAVKRADLRVLRLQTCAHLRLAGDQLRLDRHGPGVDGPRRRQHDDALPGRQEPRRRRAAALRRLPRLRRCRRRGAPRSAA